jgi:hypothetical protein
MSGAQPKSGAQPMSEAIALAEASVLAAANAVGLTCEPRLDLTLIRNPEYGILRRRVNKKIARGWRRTSRRMPAAQ